MRIFLSAIKSPPHHEREQSEQSKDAGNSIQLSRPVAGEREQHLKPSSLGLAREGRADPDQLGNLQIRRVVTGMSALRAHQM